MNDTSKPVSAKEEISYTPNLKTEEFVKAISSDLQTQWEDHFNMRNQTWKILLCSLLFFFCSIGIACNNLGKTILIFAFAADAITSLVGLFIVLHLRQRQKEKFQIIIAYEKELGLYNIISPFIKDSHKSIFGTMNTALFICTAQICLFLESTLLLFKLIIS